LETKSGFVGLANSLYIYLFLVVFYIL